MQETVETDGALLLLGARSVGAERVPCPLHQAPPRQTGHVSPPVPPHEGSEWPSMSATHRMLLPAWSACVAHVCRVQWSFSGRTPFAWARRRTRYKTRSTWPTGSRGAQPRRLQKPTKSGGLESGNDRIHPEDRKAMGRAPTPDSTEPSVRMMPLPDPQDEHFRRSKGLPRTCTSPRSHQKGLLMGFELPGVL